MILDRRTFFKIFIGMPLTTLLGSAAVAAPPKPKKAKQLLLNRFSIAGFQYYDGPKLLAGPKPGDRLHLTREPRNPHDPFAVQIHWRKANLGYVPRSDNRHLSRLLEQGAALECRVSEVDDKAVVWRRVRVEVFLN